MIAMSLKALSVRCGVSPVEWQTHLIKHDCSAFPCLSTTELSCSARAPSPFPTMFKKFCAGQKETVGNQETITEEEREDQTKENQNHEKRNKWRGVTISLRTGAQGHPTPILNPTHLPHSKKEFKHLFSHFSILWPWRSNGRPTDGQSLL